MNGRFSEREFEFCFNAEFVRKGKPRLLSMPRIPSQREEEQFGYDVAFQVAGGTLSRSIFLQHKVATFAEKRAGRNAAVFDLHGGSYFRFYLHPKAGWNQHTRLQQLAAAQPGDTVAYSVPLFSSAQALEQHFFGESVLSNSGFVFADAVIAPAPSMDKGPHSVSFNVRNWNGYVHSDPEEVDFIAGWGRSAPSHSRTPLNVGVPPRAADTFGVRCS